MIALRLAPLALLFATSIAIAEPFPMPPPGYEFHGRAIVTYLPGFPIACPLAFGASVGGCADIGANPCRVYLPSGASKRQREMIRRHELAHCAGWPANHPGALMIEFN